MDGPILFSGPMVRAILANRKRQTRRIMKPQPVKDADFGGWRWDKNKYFSFSVPALQEGMYPEACPHGAAGDTLWVRESLKRPDGDPWLYAADDMPVMADAADETAMLVWAHHKEQDHCPSIHMPRWASRISLLIEDVRVERLNDISEADVDAEGFGGDFPFRVFPELFTADCGHLSMQECYGYLWNSINGPGAWEANPWVWVITFSRIAPAEAAAEPVADEVTA